MNCCSSRRRIMSPVIVLVTRLLPKGCTVNASPYVTSPTASPPPDMSLASRSARMPPGFMNASWAPPRLSGLVAVSWASAITSPRVDSPYPLGVRVRSPWIRPMTRLASGAAAVTYWSTSALTCGSSLDGSGWRTTPGPGVLRAFSTRTLLAAACTSVPVLSSTVSVMSDSTRPNEDALVTRRVTPSGVVMVQRYSAWVWAETITLIAGSSRPAMSAIGLPARLPEQPFNAGVVWKPPSWTTMTAVLTPLRRRSAAARLAASASSWKVSPATPVGVTMVGVASSTSPMNPTWNFLPLSDLNSLVPYAGNSGLPVASTITLADRYWKSAPGYTSVVPPPARAYGAPVQPSAWHPPFWIRCSSALPLSNSWLPTAPKSACIRLVATVTGSSWNRPFASGLAPMLSPANTVACRPAYRAWRSLTPLAR